MFLVIEPAFVTSPCPLLPAEAASDFLPQVCMRVPAGSAWVPQQIDVACFADARGAIRDAELEAALCAAVDAGDQLHDSTVWPEAATEYDSWLNRRLAIALRGWGDIVERRGDAPESLQALRELEALVEWSCSVVHRRSRQLARHRNWCPSLDEAGAVVRKTPGSGGWRRRWRKALRDVAVRHRNLTTISPWDVFPRQKPADLRFADLLPITRYADSMSFHCDVSISHWNVSEFNSFYSRVAAISRQSGEVGLVAKQV